MTIKIILFEKRLKSQMLFDAHFNPSDCPLKDNLYFRIVL